MLAALTAQGAEDRFANVEVTVQHLAGSVHLLRGAGGNIAVSVGPDGTFMVDDDYSPLTERIHAAIEKLGGSGFDRPAGITFASIHARTRCFSSPVAACSRSSGVTVSASLREKKITVNFWWGTSPSSERASSSSTIGSARIIDPEASITYTIRRALELERPTKVAV